MEKFSKKTIKYKALVLEKKQSINLFNQHKENKFKKFEIKNKNKNCHLALSLIILFFQIILSNESKIKLRKLNYNTEIELTIKGSGDQYILNEKFNKMPDEILVNGKNNGDTGIKVYNLINEENIITLKWNEPLISYYKIFQDLSNITKIDFLNFGTTKIKDMNFMFYNCESLKSINFNNLDTSSITAMDSMFYGCVSLESLDLRNFDTSSVIIMHRMFFDCISLTSLDLSNFNTSSATNMYSMFCGCSSLETLDISNFNTKCVTNMNSMFSNCKKLKSLNLNHFNTTCVIDMYRMFYGCSSLTSLEINNFDTSLINNMDSMFYGCSSLISLNLESFNTSKVEFMLNMFYDCRSLESLNIKNFYTPLCKNMYKMFFNCISLTSLNLNNFDTSNVENMEGMFYNCNSLKSLDLNNFNTSKVNFMLTMFFNCSSLIYLNLNNFETSSLKNIDNMFSSCSSLMYLNMNKFNTKSINIPNIFYNSNKENIIFCIDKENNPNIISQLNIENLNCSDICFHESKKFIIEKKICILNCASDDICNYESTNIFYNESFLNDTDISSFDNKFIEAFQTDKITENFTFSTYNTDIQSYSSLEMKQTEKMSDNVIPSIYKTDFQSYNNLEMEQTDKMSDIAISSIYNTDILSKNEDSSEFVQMHKSTNYIESSIYNTEINSYSNNPTELSKTDKLTNKITFEYNSDIQSNNNEMTESSKTNKITDSIDSSLYFTEIQSYNISNILDNEIIKNWNVEKFFNGTFEINNLNPLIKDEIIKIIKDDIKNGKINFTNITEEKFEDLVLKGDDTIYQITTTDNQNNNQYCDISTVKLGQCEEILKNVYNINKELPLIIFKVDYYVPGLLIPVIGYEIYHPINNSKLDLTYCKNEIVDFNIPVKIDEENLFKYDPNSEYYTDECYPYTTDNGTDILLNDRKDEYISNNMSLCENNCNFDGYEQDSKKSICKCGIKTQELVISEIDNDNNLLSNNFTDKTSSSSNIVTMKCVYTLFTKEGLSKNIGSYILLFIIILFIILGILFYKIGFHLINENIKKILKLKEKNEKIIISDKLKISNEKNTKIKTKIIKKRKSSSKKNEILEIKPKIKKKKKSKRISNKVSIYNISKISNSKSNSNSKAEIKFSKNFDYSNLKSNKIYIYNNNNNNNNKKESLNFTDYELNTFLYKMALIYDKRTFSQYYFSLIKTKHPIIFGLIPINDYNTIIIKLSIILLFISINYTINSIFFNDSVIHKIYEDKGIYNFIYLIPKILSSFIFSHIFYLSLKYLFLSERNLLEIKNEKTLKKANIKSNKVKRCLVIKYICFYIIGFILLLFFWYYLSSFGAVYQNTQLYLFKTTMISLAFSLIYPFIINFFPSIFRIISLRNRKKNKEFLYIISKIIQIL